LTVFYTRMEIEIGNIYKNINCESFLDEETNRIRVRPCVNQIVSSDLVIECSKAIRESHPIGTVFICEEVKVCKKQTGRIYLRAKNQMIYIK
jgi:hypothetical protein